MTILTISKNHFELIGDDDVSAGHLRYEGQSYNRGEIEASSFSYLRMTGTGIWDFFAGTEAGAGLLCRIRVESGGKIKLHRPEKGKTYLFKKSTGWKIRFSLMNKKEEVLTLIPKVNWAKEAHDYILQLNEEFEEECDSFLILQAVHCANCSLGMMTGGTVPALVSI